MRLLIAINFNIETRSHLLALLYFATKGIE